MTDECKMLEENESNESNTADNKDWNPDNEFEWLFGPLSWPTQEQTHKSYSSFENK